MSIINQMLRDIDKRDKKVDGEESSKPSDVYLPKPAQDKRIKFGIAGGGVAIIIVLAIWLGVNPGTEVPEPSIASTVTESTVTESMAVESTVAESIATESTAAESTAMESSSAEGGENGDVYATIDSAAETTATTATTATTVATTSSPQPVAATPRSAPTSSPTSVPAQEPAQARAPEPTAPITQSAVASAPVQEQPRATATVTRSGANASGSAEAAYREGMRELRNANQPGAIQQFRDALERDAMHHEARLELAVLLFSRGALNEALQLLAAGQQLAPNFNEFRLVEARILVRAGDLEEALQVLNGTSTILPTDADIFILRGSLATELGQYGVAVHSYRELVTWRPNQGTWWLGLGYALEMNGERAEAAEAYRQALRDTRLTAESRRFVMDRREGLSY